MDAECRRAELELLVGEGVQVGEAMVLLDAGGSVDVVTLVPGADAADLPPDVDEMVGVAVPQLGADVEMLRQVVAESHAVAVLPAAP